jgi:hypothetical protein
MVTQAAGGDGWDKAMERCLQDMKQALNCTRPDAMRQKQSLLTFLDDCVSQTELLQRTTPWPFSVVVCFSGELVLELLTVRSGLHITPQSAPVLVGLATSSTRADDVRTYQCSLQPTVSHLHIVHHRHVTSAAL